LKRKIYESFAVRTAATAAIEVVEMQDLNNASVTVVEGNPHGKKK